MEGFMEGSAFGVICILLGLFVWQYRQRTWELQKQEEDEALRRRRLRRKQREAEEAEEDASESPTLELPRQMKKKG
jgi:hypothetical protein